MTTQITQLSLAEKQQLQTNRLQRLGLFIVFLICGLAVLFLGSNFYKIFPTNQNLTYDLIVCAAFLAAALWFKYDKRLNGYWQITFAFFITSIIYPITTLTANWKSEVLGLAATVTSQGTAVDKVFQMVLTVLPILVLIKLSGADLGSIISNAAT